MGWGLSTGAGPAPREGSPTQPWPLSPPRPAGDTAHAPALVGECIRCASASVTAAMLLPRLTSLLTFFCGANIECLHDVYTPLIDVYTPPIDVYTPLTDVYTPLINVYPPFSSSTIEWLVPAILSLSRDLRESPPCAREDVVPMTAPPLAAWTRVRAAHLSAASA